MSNTFARPHCNKGSMIPSKRSAISSKESMIRSKTYTIRNKESMTSSKRSVIRNKASTKHSKTYTIRSKASTISRRILTTKLVQSWRVLFHCLSLPPSNSRAGIGGPRPSQWSTSHHERRVPLREQTGVSEGNEEGGPRGH